MKIETSYEIKPLPRNGDARLIVTTTINGKYSSSHIALSGPEVDIRAFVNDEIDGDEIKRRWGMSEGDGSLLSS